MRRLGLALLACGLVAGLTAEAQPLSGGLLGRGASYTSFVPPASCGAGEVPYFDSSFKLVCSPTVYAPTTDTTTLGTVAARNVTATGLPTPGAITVTPVLTRVGSITTVAGASLVDGDYFTIKYAPGLTVPCEFDLSPGDGTTGGAVPILFTAGDSADLIRDNIILTLNAAAGTALTASSGGAATVSLVLDTPGAAGDTNTENVANAGFAVTGFVNPTAATTVTYKLVAKLPDGTTTEAGAASSTAASVATLTAANFNRLSWSAVTGASSYAVYRTVAPTSPATTGIIYTGTALTVDDVALAGGGETAPTVNGTGRVIAAAGSSASPGVRVGAEETGLFRKSSTSVGLAAAGAEVFSSTSSTAAIYAQNVTIGNGGVTLRWNGADRLGIGGSANPGREVAIEGMLATAADSPGRPLTIRSGNGLGSGAVTDAVVRFQTPDTRASGSTYQLFATRSTISTTAVTDTVPSVLVSPSGATWTRGYSTELLTLSTAGTTTDTSADLLPANSIIEAVTARVTTTITTATNWQLGDATTPGRFTTANGTLVAGTTDVGLVHVDQTGAAGPRQTTAAKVRVTTTGTPGAGVVRVTVFYRQLVPPSS